MRFLVIVSDLGPGGTQRSAQNCAVAFSARGHEVAVFALHEGGPRVEELESRGIQVFVGGEGSDALEQATAWGADVIHLHGQGSANPEASDVLRTIKGGSTTRIPVIMTNHFARVDESEDRTLVDVSMQLSGWCLWKWSQWSRHLRPRPVGVIVPHMIVGDAFFPETDGVAAAFRRQHEIPDDAFLFGRIGQPIEPKWSRVIFPAFSEIALERPNAWLVLVGAPPAYRDTIEALPPTVRRRVVWIDFLSGDAALRACYTALDGFLHAAQIGESFGMVLAEAMLCRCPVVTLATPTRDNSQLEVVGHERGGLVAANPADLAPAMRRLMDEPGLADRLGRDGAAWCREAYAVDTIAPMMISIAEMATQHAEPDDLRAALAANEVLEQGGSTADTNALLQRMIGRCSMRDRVMMAMVHRPAVYRLWRKLGR